MTMDEVFARDLCNRAPSSIDPAVLPPAAQAIEVGASSSSQEPATRQEQEVPTSCYMSAGADDRANRQWPADESVTQ